MAYLVAPTSHIQITFIVQWSILTSIFTHQLNEYTRFGSIDVRKAFTGHKKPSITPCFSCRRWNALDSFHWKCIFTACSSNGRMTNESHTIASHVHSADSSFCDNIHSTYHSEYEPMNRWFAFRQLLEHLQLSTFFLFTEFFVCKMRQFNVLNKARRYTHCALCMKLNHVLCVFLLFLCCSRTNRDECIDARLATMKCRSVKSKRFAEVIRQKTMMIC